MRHIADPDVLTESPRAALDDVAGMDPVSQLPAIPLTPIPVTGRTGPRPGY